MPKHFERDLEELKKDILTVGAMVENAINRAITALLDRRPELANEVVEGDNVIDEMELEVEEDCLKILALHQPVAADLRLIIAILKVNNDLERMGDLAVNIAERASYLTTHEPLAVPQNFSRMVAVVRSMVHDSLAALVALDAQLARSVLKQDDTVDEINKQMYVVMQDLMRKDPAFVERAVNMLSVSRQLERIADSATNIAEDVIFMAEGNIVRHRVTSRHDRVAENEGAKIQ